MLYLAEGISSKSVEEYVRECDANGIYIRALQIMLIPESRLF